MLWLGLTSKNAAVQQKFKDFFTLWPESRARIPYAIMQEMRITPELPGYQDLVKSIFFELIDGKLTTEEEIRAVSRAAFASGASAAGHHSPHPRQEGRAQRRGPRDRRRRNTDPRGHMGTTKAARTR